MFISPHNGFSLGAYYCKWVTGDEGYKITKNKSTITFLLWVGLE